MRSFVVVAVLVCIIHAEWPVDDEPYGFLGCKQLKYLGIWESKKDTIHPDESIDGICISVALANTMIYYQWPPFSRFDGIYLTSSYDGVTKKIDQYWNYNLITGPRTVNDCETDDPKTRHLPEKPEWTGIDEMRRLLYSVERSFGFNSDYLRTKDSTACNGEGYYSLEHVLRNRFGYPNSTTIDANKPESRKIVINNLKKNIPVIAMRCDHIYLLDGYKYDDKKKRDLVHSSDYLQGDVSIGWFPWKALYIEKLDRFIVDVYPQYHLPKGPSKSNISYFWGEGYIPGTQYTQRKGRIFIYRENDQPLGSLEITLQSMDLTPYADDSITILYKSKKYFNQKQIIIPETGYFDFDIVDIKKLDLVIKNNDPFNKNVRVLFCDVVKEQS